MATTYNAPNSDYNKDQTFGALNITEGYKVEFSEAVIKENEDKIVVFANVTAVEKLNVMGDRSLTSETWTPRLCKFTILKKDQEYKGKKIPVTPGMRTAAHLIATMEGKPFKGFFNFNQDEMNAHWVLTGESSFSDKTPIPESLRETVTKNAGVIEPIEELEALKGIDIPELGNGGSYKKGFSSGQTEKQKLNDKIDWLLEMAEPESKLVQLIVKVDPENDNPSGTAKTVIFNLMEKLLG